jgi:FAD/FMN-containing dehydrogenase
MRATSSIPLSALELSAAIRDERPYDAARLDRVLRVDESHGLVEVQAGTEWKTIAASLRPGDARAAAVRTTMRTVGESVAANTAGPDGRTAICHVESIALVTPGGELRRISRTANRELFALVAGGQGLFGVLYSVTLDMGSLSRAVNEAAAAEVLSPAQGAIPSRAMQLLVPPEALGEFLADARSRCEAWRLPLRGIEVRRTHEDRDSFLRWARREYAAVTLQLPEPPVLGAAVRSTQLRRELLDAAIARGGSFPVWCTSDATRAQVEACYPQLRSFLAEKRRVDPAERLTNAWYRHYRSLFARGTCEVRWAH